MKKMTMLAVIPAIAVVFLLLVSQLNIFSFALNQPIDGDVTVFVGKNQSIVGRLFDREDSQLRWYPGLEDGNSIFLNNLSNNNVRLNWAKVQLIGVYDQNEDGSKGLSRDDLSASVLDQYAVRLSDGTKTYYEGLLGNFSTEQSINEIIQGKASDKVLDVQLQLLETAGNELQNLIIDLHFDFDFIEIVSSPAKPRDGTSTDDFADFGDEGIALAPGQIHWADDEIEYLYEIDILTAIPGSLDPGVNVNRAEASTLVMRLLGYQAEKTPVFDNVYLDNLPTYANDYILKGTEDGILKGYPDGYFRPYDPVTREEFAAMIDRAFDLDGEVGSLTYYKDYDTFSDTWGIKHLEGMHTKGYYIGYTDQTLRPKSYLSNAESFIVLYRIAKELEVVE